MYKDAEKKEGSSCILTHSVTTTQKEKKKKKKGRKNEKMKNRTIVSEFGYL